MLKIANNFIAVHALSSSKEIYFTPIYDLELYKCDSSLRDVDSTRVKLGEFTFQNKG